MAADTVRKRSKVGEERKQKCRILNLLLSNDDMAKINSSQSRVCEGCKVPETIEHNLYDCDKFEDLREILKNDVLRIAACEDLNVQKWT